MADFIEIEWVEDNVASTSPNSKISTPQFITQSYICLGIQHLYAVIKGHKKTSLFIRYLSIHGDKVLYLITALK